MATTTEGELTATVTATAIVEDEPVTHPFTDIAATGHEAEIAALFNAGITTGTSATTFSPGAPITRAQFAVMIARALQVTPTTATTFTDTQGKWYEADVQALQEIGIITGTSATTFEPGKHITRQHAAVMIHRMLHYKGYVNIETTLSYTDATKISAYAEEAFAQLQHQQIMTGNNGEISPQASLTRSQMAKVLKRALDVSGYEF